MEYEIMINNELDSIIEEDTIGERCSDIKIKIKRSVQKWEKAEKKQWFDTECRAELRTRNKLGQ